jgi:hypothetical protein
MQDTVTFEHELMRRNEVIAAQQQMIRALSEEAAKLRTQVQ